MIATTKGTVKTLHSVPVVIAVDLVKRNATVSALAQIVPPST
jgi:hypothetical protein